VPLPTRVALCSVIALVQVEMGSGRGAAVGRVTKLVDVKAVPAGLQVAHVARDLDGILTLKMKKYISRIISRKLIITRPVHQYLRDVHLL
jgi:hypothetical protein